MSAWRNRLSAPLTLCLSPKAGKLAVERGWAINVGECWPAWPGRPGGREGQGDPGGGSCESEAVLPPQLP